MSKSKLSKKQEKKARKTADKYSSGDYNARKKIRAKQDKKFNKTIKKARKGMEKKDKHAFPKSARIGDTYIKRGKAWKRVKGRGAKKWKQIEIKEARKSYPKPKHW